MDDKKAKEQIKVLREAAKKNCASKSAVLKSLKDAGIVTSSGKLTKRFGGK